MLCNCNIEFCDHLDACVESGGFCPLMKCSLFSLLSEFQRILPGKFQTLQYLSKFR